MKKLTNKEIELIQNALLFFCEAEQITDEVKDKVFDPAWEKLIDMLIDKKSRSNK